MIHEALTYSRFLSGCIIGAWCVGPALVAFVGPALVAFVGPALVAFWANACCDDCIPTIVKDVSSIAEIAIADSVGTFTYCIFMH